MSSRSVRTVGAIGCALAMSVTGPGSVAGAAPHTASRAVSQDVVVVGHGWGHGRGLGQFGAYGYAVTYGWSYARILSHYYGETRPGRISNRNISVRLSSLEGPANPLRSTGSWITSAQDFSVGTWRVAGGSAARIVRSGNTWHLFTKSHGCSAGRSFGPVKVATPVVATAGRARGVIARMLEVCASGHSYRGTLRAVFQDGIVHLVNTLPMESYLRGVVPRESPAGWGDGGGGRGMAALQAQAVAARSYAQAENRYPPEARTCDTTSCQVYGGAADHGVRLEDPRTNRAVATTTGQVRVDARNRVVRTEFSSSTGGWTVPDGPWPAVRDQGDSMSPLHTWTTTLDGAALANRYGVGAFLRLLVIAQNGLGAEGGRVETVRVVGTRGSRTMSGAQFSADWSLSSDWFFPVDQPRQQVTWLRYVRKPHEAQIYRQFSLVSHGWTDVAPISTADWVAKGRPPVMTAGPRLTR